MKDKNKLIDKIIKIIEERIPTDEFGAYGGSSAMSDEEICDMFLEDLIPEIEKLKN